MNYFSICLNKENNQISFVSFGEDEQQVISEAQENGLPFCVFILLEEPILFKQKLFNWLNENQIPEAEHEEILGLVLNGLRETFRPAQVFHAKNPDFGLSFLATEKDYNLDDYELVAEVPSSDLDEIFKLTNSIDEPWTKNEEILSFKRENLRSTSVGDIVILPNKKTFVCEMVGWKEIFKET